MIDLKAIRAAAEAATKGSWRVTAQGSHVVSVESGRICSSPAHMAQWNWDANAGHIATANPATVIALLDRLEAAEKDAARYRWMTANYKLWSWQPKRYNANTTSGFAFNGTGYLGYSFEGALTLAMKD